MAQELEAKFRVESFRAVRKALRDAGAAGGRTVAHLDRFFDTADRAIHRGGRGLRLRRMRPAGKGGSIAWLLTYKGPVAAARKVKVRKEIQTSVGDGDAIAAVFACAGFKCFMAIEKRRTSFRLGRCLIELDELPMLGRFVEIEAPHDRAIEKARRRLGLTGEPIAETYLHLAAERCRRVGRSCRQITFARCGRCPSRPTGRFA